MQDPQRRRELPLEAAFPVVCGAFAAAMAASALFGWMTANEGLKRIYPTFVAMNPATAVCLALAGLSLALLKHRPNFSRALAAAVAAIVATKILSLVSGAGPNIDQILFAESLVDRTGSPNRMAPNTAIAISLLAGALLLSSGRSRRSVLLSQVTAGASAAIAAFAIIGYVLGMATLYGFARFIPMAAHTAVAVFILSCGTIAARNDVGLMLILRDKGPAGALARTALPLAILIPVGVGLLRIAGQRAELYGTEAGVALQVLANVLVTFFLLLGSIYALWRSDCLRREKEDALARSEQEYRLAEEVGKVGHWRMELPSRSLGWSQEIFRIAGRPPAEGVPDAATVLGLYHPADREKARDAVVHALKTGEGWSFIVRLIHADGGVRHVRSDGLSERDEDGRVAALFGVFADVTDLEEARRRAEAASAAKATFLANMSHEVRTPLNSIIGFTDLLLDDPGLDDRKRHQLQMVQKSGSLLMTVVDDILNVSKLEAGAVELHLEPFALEALIDNSTSMVRSIAEAKGLQLAASVDPDISAYHLGDEGRLRQVLLNLLNNALKFTRSGSIKLEVQCVRATERVDRLRFSVADTGPGIPAEKQHRLFKQFSQADASVSRQFGGTGLGLSISKSLITLMGGHIGAVSEEGVGSTFWFEVDLPRAEASRSPAAALSKPASGAAVAATRILLVEDIPFNQELAEAILVRAGHSVRIAADGLEALKVVALEPFDLVLMDIQMPRMDGITATRRIREMEGAASRLPIIAMTANVLPEQIREFRAAGMDGHVAKPIKQAELHAAIAAAMASQVNT